MGSLNSPDLGNWYAKVLYSASCKLVRSTLGLNSVTMIQTHHYSTAGSKKGKIHDIINIFNANLGRLC